ncbi:hypothetical protein ACGFX4_33215 [Kitasatospora sp. NPDC048365]|uniref:hypothetical protein n=1 Tax=Kitasatospora sp. NPDC048365 TaxID=3364050 RepID=UPI00371A4622
MTVAPLVRNPAPAAPPPGTDRLLVPLAAARAALGRLERLGRPAGPVEPHGDRAAFPLAPGAAELVPELLRWLGWGEELRLPVELDAGGRAAADRVPAQCGADEPPPHPDRSAPGPALDLGSPDLLRLLDCLADACLRLRLGLPQAR